MNHEILAAAIDHFTTEYKTDCDIIRGGCGEPSDLDDHEHEYAQLVAAVVAAEDAEDLDYTEEQVESILAAADRTPEDLCEDVGRIGKEASKREIAAMCAEYLPQTEEENEDDCDN